MAMLSRFPAFPLSRLWRCIMPEENSLQDRINEIAQAIITKSGIDGGYVEGIAITALIFEAAYIAAGEVVGRIWEGGLDMKAMQMEIAKLIVSQIQVVAPAQSMASSVLHPGSTGLQTGLPNIPTPVADDTGRRQR